ncbi:MAG: hypothetical protein MJD61_18635 [Proteobacteria bacterium]|nr:hypothetical protein [Pseudomonadota bacterium]
MRERRAYRLCLRASPSGSAVIGDTYSVGDDEDVHTFEVTANLLEAGPVQVLWNGKIWVEQQGGPGSVNITWQAMLEDMPSGWVTVRTPHVQTSPIYVIVHGRPIHDPFGGSLPQWRPDPGAPCRMTARVDELIRNTNLRGGTPAGIMNRYIAAWWKYRNRRVGSCDLNNPPDPPSLPPPGNDERGDYPNAFPGRGLPLSADTRRVTGRLVPSNDQDHFFIQARCPNTPTNKDYLRARVALRTEARENLSRYVLDYCWSDPGVRCSVRNPPETGPALVTKRVDVTPLGGGTTANAPLDVKCTPNQLFWLSIAVRPGGAVGNDIYSLFYSVEAVDDGFRYSNGSGAGEFPAGGQPTNP